MPERTNEERAIEYAQSVGVSKGAALAAEIILNDAIDSGQIYDTTHGEKTVLGIARIIDNQTTAPDLLQALKGVASAHAQVETCDMPEWLEAVEAAIAKAS